MNLAAVGEKAFHSPRFLLACLLGIGFLSANLHPLDSIEGMILTGAWNLLQGRDLYQDSFEYFAPGSYYLIAWVWQLLGTASYEAAKVTALAVAAGACLAIFHTARLLAGPRITVLPALGYFLALLSGPVINPKALFILPAAWSLYLAVQGILRDRRQDCIYSGLLCGCAILVLQDQGIALAASLALAIYAARVRQDKRRALLLSGDFVLAILIPVFLLFKWDIGVIIENLILFPMHHSLEVQRGDFLAWLGAVLLWCWIQWRILALRPGPALLPLGIAQVGLLLTVLQQPDAYGAVAALFPAAALFPLLLRTDAYPSSPAAPAADRLAKLAGAGISAGLFLFVFSLFLASAAQVRASSHFRSVLVDALERHCGGSGYLYAGPFIPGLYFESRKLNATRYSILLERFNTEAQFFQARQDLERTRPGCLAIDGRLGEKFGHTGRNPVEDWAALAYETVEQIGAVKLMRPVSAIDEARKPPSLG